MNNFLLLMTLMAFLLWTPTGFSKASAEAAGGWGKTYKLSTLTKMEVRNFQGEKLGEIEDFVMDAESGRVALVIFFHPGMAGLGRKVKIIPFGLLIFREEEKTFLLNLNKEDLNPEIAVKNHQGEQIGIIKDLVMDFMGRIPFVILSHKEKPIIIPLSALSVDQSRNFFILDANEEKLASAPPYQEDSLGESQAEEIYRYFGQHPYWQSEDEEQPSPPQQFIPLPEF